MASKQTLILESALDRGFDRSERSGRRGVHIGCSQCEALVICGIPTHEFSCPNGRRYECRECGQSYRSAELAWECCSPIDDMEDIDNAE